MKGADLKIEQLALKFENNLWTDFDFVVHRRVQRDEVFNRRPIPMILVDSERNEYRDVLLDSAHDAICFFDVLPQRTGTVEYRAKAWICFMVKLNKLYPGYGRQGTEYVHSDVKQILLTDNFTPVDLITDLDSFRPYDLVQTSDNLQPFYLFRYVTEFTYQDNC